MGCGGVERHLEMAKPTKIVRKRQNGDLKNHTPTIFGSYSLLLKLLAKWKIEKENYLAKKFAKKASKRPK